MNSIFLIQDALTYEIYFDIYSFLIKTITANFELFNHFITLKSILCNFYK